MRIGVGSGSFWTSRPACSAVKNTGTIIWATLVHVYKTMLTYTLMKLIYLHRRANNCCPCHRFSLPWGNQGHQPNIWKRDAGNGSQEKILKVTSILLIFLQPMPEVPWEKQALRHPKPCSPSLASSHTRIQGRIFGHEPLSWAVINCLFGSQTASEPRIFQTNCHMTAAKNQQLFQLTRPGRAVNATKGKAASWAGALLG